MANHSAIQLLAAALIAGLMCAGPVNGYEFGPLSPNNQSAQNNLLEIRVVDDYTARPIPSAQVTLWGDGAEIGTAQTDGQGIATFALPTGADESPDLPRALSLSPNYPNPFLDETRVDMAVPEEQVLTATVFNILGQRVATQQLPVQAGYHTLTMSLGHLATGVYFLRVDGRTSQTVSLFRMGGGVQRSGPAFSVAPGPAPAGDPAGTPGPIPIRVGHAATSTGATGVTSTGTATSTASSLTAASPGSTSTPYTIRVEKDRFDIHEGSLAVPPSRRVSVPLSRNNLVEFVVTDGQGAPAPRQLEITAGNFQSSITTPHTLTLKSGVYSAAGDIGDGIALAYKVEIPSVDTTIVLRFDEAGVLLPGEPQARASEAAYDLDIRIAYPAGAVADDPDLLYGGQVLRTEIELILDPAATVAQMNELLDTYDAQIVSMLPDNIVFVIRVPDPGSVGALNDLVADLMAEPIVWLASKSVIVEEQEPVYDAIMGQVTDAGKGTDINASGKGASRFEIYPGSTDYQPGGIQQIPGHTTAMSRIDHHLAARAHAAWNLRSAIVDMDQRPYIVIADYFGDGVPGAGYNASFHNADFANSTAISHGYHVLGIINGMYDRVEALEAGSNDVAGMFPERLFVRAVDLADPLMNTWPRRMNAIISRINTILEEDRQARIVVNTSLNSRNLASQNDMAISWITRVRRDSVHTRHAGLETRFVHLTSAGNNRIVDGNIVLWPAHDNSLFNHAALLDLTLDNRTVPRLTNTIVIENRVNTPHADTEQLRRRPMPGCASNRSIMGGTLSAMGSSVWSFGDCLVPAATGCQTYRSDPHASFLSGTSMATPQAAGLAAYLWAVNPNLTVSNVMDIMFNTSVADTSRTTPGFNCHEDTPMPVIDAYAAVLTAGAGNARLALLDVNDDGVFDHLDLEIIIDSLRIREGALDYSRFDLNGDGFTGADSTYRFDLDMNGQYTVVWGFIDGDPVSFDERHLTDMDILCYYAWSDLYQGDPDQREELLFGLCGEPETDVVIDIDGNVYPIVQVGTQWWMAENLRVTHYRNGDPIPNVTDADEWVEFSTGAWAYYDNEPGNNIPYGKLYNWYAVADSRGLCPAGWHPASRDPGSPYSWSRLSVELGGIEVAGEKMKSTYGWIDDGNGTNESGYNGLPGGARLGDGTFSRMGHVGYWWTGTDGFGARPHEAWFYYLSSGSSELLHHFGVKTAGQSVRCVRQ